jgi:hypothetical protein
MWITFYPHLEKAPREKDWPEKAQRITPATIDQYFANGGASPTNIGILLGHLGLADQDFDSPEALQAARAYDDILATGWIFGRRSKPASHRFFYADPPLKTAQFQDPAANGGAKAMLLELRCLNSRGEIGLQTMAPPSLHPEGETVEFTNRRVTEPARISANLLLRTSRHIAAAALLGRYWPAEGARHQAFLALAGGLAHAGWDQQDAIRLVTAIYYVLWKNDADADAARKEVESTWQRFDDGGEVTGWPHLEPLFDRRVFRQALKWLEIDPGAGGPPEEPKDTQAKIIVKVLTMKDLAALPPVDRQLRIEGNLPKAGLGIISGTAKHGKSIWASDVAFSVGTGKALFDFYSVTMPGNVLIVTQDDPDGHRGVYEILQKRGISNEDQRFCVIQKDDRYVLGPGLIAGLEDRIREYKIVMLILDSYTALRGTHRKNSDIVLAERNDLIALDEFGKRLGISVLLIHHDSKSSSALGWMQKAAGTYAVSAAVETQINISQFFELDPGAPERLVRLVGRHMPARDMVLRLRTNDDFVGFEFVLEGGAATLYPFLYNLKLEFAGRTFSVKDIMTEMGVPRATAFRDVRRLYRAGALQKTGTTSEYRIVIKL